MVQLGLIGNVKAASAIYYKFLDFTNLLFADGSPAGIKAALEIKKMCGNWLRLPLVPVNQDVYNLIKKQIGAKYLYGVEA